MHCRGIRGAITVDENNEEQILSAVHELLEIIRNKNGVSAEDIGAIFFSTTPDLNAAFPARAARQMGWNHVPMMCSHEMDVPGSLPKCIRLLLLWNTELAQEKIQHVYLRAATSLRPDLASIAAPL